MKNRMIMVFVCCVLACSGLFSGSALALEAGGVDIHGFVSQGFIFSEDYEYLTNNSKNGSFEYNEIGINFSKDLSDRLRLGIQLFSRDLGDVGNNKVTVDWAYGDYRVKDWLGIRAGRIKLPLGFYNETRDIDMLRTNVVMPQSIYADLLRDTVIAANGVGLYGNIDLYAMGSLDYQLVAGSMNIENENGFEKFFNVSYKGMFVIDGHSDSEITYAGGLRWNTPLDGLSLGVSALTNTVDSPVLIGGALKGKNSTDNTAYTVGVEYLWEDLTVAAEYQQYQVEYTLTSPMGSAKGDQTTEGYYLSAAYRFTDLFSLGAYYSVLYIDKDDKSGDNFAFANDAWEKDLALSLRFDINDYTAFKVEGHHVDGTARVNATDNPIRSEDKFLYGVAKVTFSF
ncbi:MAG: porin [Desulfobacterium sp.]|nr:porin [Desulfobacterium sp.]